MLNTMQKLAIWVSFSVALVFVWGCLSLALAGETRVAFPVFYQLMVYYPVSDMLVIAPKAADGSVSAYMDAASCLTARSLRAHPEEYFCLKYESAKTVQLP